MDGAYPDITFRIFTPIETLINIILSLNFFTSMTFSTHFPQSTLPHQPTLPHNPSRRTCIACLPRQAICYPRLYTLFPESNRNPNPSCPPYLPTHHLFPTSSQHLMNQLSTGNPVDYQAF